MCCLSCSTSKHRFYSVLKNLCTLTVLKCDKMDSEVFYSLFCILGSTVPWPSFQTFHCTFTVSRIRASSLARADLLRPPTRKESQDQRKLHNHQPAAVFHSGFRVESPWVLLRESRCCARERTAVSRTLSAPGAEFHQNVGLCTGNRFRDVGNSRPVCTIGREIVVWWRDWKHIRG